MGFLEKVFGTGDTTLTLRVDRDRLTVGDDVVLHWEVGGELDEKVRGIRAGVTATAYWLEREVDRDADGSRDVDIERHEGEEWSHVEELPAQLGAGSATVTIPADAPPGSKDVLKWTAWVAIDRERGRDHAEEVALHVRRPAVEASPVEASGDGIVVTGIPDRLRLGARHAGHVSLTVPEAMAGTLRLFLVRRVRYASASAGADLVEFLNMPKLPGTDLFGRAGFQDGAVVERSSEEVELDLSGGKQELEPGHAHEFGFELEVPGRGPTTEHRHAQVDWRVVVKLDRRLRGDLRVAFPVEVS